MILQVNTEVITKQREDRKNNVNRAEEFHSYTVYIIYCLPYDFYKHYFDIIISY